MRSLMLGLTAALIWGLHDFVVRQVSGRAEVAVLLPMSLVSGAVLLAPIASLQPGWASLTPPTLGLALVSGAFFALASVGLYHAFAIGPVRLVVPICGAYPMLSVAFAVLRGHPIGPLVWFGAAAAVAGIALVARSTKEGGKGDSCAGTLRAAGWATLAAIGYSSSLGLSQMAAEQGSVLPVALITRLGAAAAVTLWIAASRPAITPALRLWRPLALMGAMDITAMSLITRAGGLPHPEYAAVTSSVFGMVTILLAWRFLGEAIRPVQWMGVLAVFSGIATLAAT